MKFENFEKVFSRRLTNGKFEELLDLGLNVCKKLYFDYDVFIKSTACFGDPDFVLDAIAQIKRYSTEAATGPMITTLHDKLLFNVKSLESFRQKHQLQDDLKATYAYYAIDAVDATFFYLLTAKTNCIHNAAANYLLSVHLKVQENRVLTDEEVYNHPTVQAAMAFLLGGVGQSA